jgi:hypothetical protein
VTEVTPSNDRSLVGIAFEAFAKQVIPTSFFCLLIAGCSGALPPMPVCGALLFGASAAWILHRLRRDRLVVVIACMTGIVCIVLLWPRVSIRAATAADRVYERYFGGPQENFTARNIAVVEGTFVLSTWLTGQLYHVQDGELRELNGFSVGRSSNQVGAPHWVDMRITLALIQYESDRGSITQLGSAGHSRGGGGKSEIPTSVTPTHSFFTSGRLLSGQSRILYVEGDSQFQLTTGMTVETFAQANKGNYYVVVVGLQ